MTSLSRLLVVDDEVRQLDALCMLLRDEGFEVTACDGARQALVMLAEQPFDLLLSDLMMPDLDGLELIRQARINAPDLVAVLMTGHATVESAREAMKEGVLDYISKPFRMSEIRPVIQQALEVKRLRDDNKKMIQIISEQNSELTVVNAELNTFASRIAHDMQAVNNVAGSFAGILRKQARDRLTEKDLHFLDRIIASSKRGTQLIQDMLSFARLGSRPLKLSSVELADVVSKSISLVESGFLDRTVKWEVGPLPHIQGDRSLLMQVFSNLLSNALKYSKNQDVSIIQINARKLATCWEVSVQDNGVGFPSESAHLLFQPFERLHSQAQFEGNGLGLANVKKIVERHGGQVRAESLPEQGACFAFTLPFDIEVPAQVEANLVAPPIAPEPFNSRKLRILVVDDDQNVLASLRALLELDGHHVTTASGGSEGIDVFEKANAGDAHFHVVITDLSMPHVDGSVVAERVKAARSTTRVILLSGWTGGLEISPAAVVAIDKTLSKPVRLAVLREAIQGSDD